MSIDIFVSNAKPIGAGISEAHKQLEQGVRGFDRDIDIQNFIEENYTGFHPPFSILIYF